MKPKRILEFYKDLKGLEQFYAVSDKGNIYSKRLRRVITPDPNNCGYLRVQLRGNGIRTREFVHRLVALHFCEGYFEGAQVDHVDGDRTNNNASNLEWVTQSTNMKRVVKRAGLHNGHFQSNSYRVKDMTKPRKKSTIVVGVKALEKLLKKTNPTIIKYAKRKRLIDGKWRVTLIPFKRP